MKIDLELDVDVQAFEQQFQWLLNQGDALGDSDELEGLLNMMGAVRDALEAQGAEVQLEGAEKDVAFDSILRETSERSKDAFVRDWYMRRYPTDIIERYEAGEDVAEFIDRSWRMWHSAPLDTLDDSIVGKWRVHLVMPGDRYGVDDCLTYDPTNAKACNNLPLVEFYDTSQDESRFPGGQFVSRYYMSTLLGLDGLSTSESIAEVASRNGSLSLRGDVPAWTVSSSELSVIARRLEKAHEAIIQKDFHEDAADLDVERASAKGACRDVNEPSAPGRDDLGIG